MDRRYWAVARAYCRTWAFATIALLMLVALVEALRSGSPEASGGSPPRRDPIRAFVILGFLGATWSSGAAATFVKKRLARPQAALIPGFGEPHVVVTLVSLTLVVLSMAVIGRQAGASAWATVPLLLAIVASTLWLAHVATAFVFMLVFPCFFLIKGRTSHEAIVQFMSSWDWSFESVGIAALSILALYAWARRVMQLREEMFDYKLDFPGETAPATTSGRDAADYVQIGLSRRLNKLTGYVGTRTRERVELWRLGNKAMAPWAEVLGFTAVILIFAAFYALVAPAGAPPVDVIAPRVLVGVWPIWLPCQRLATTLDRKWWAEALRPCDRSRMLREAGLGLALDMLYAWAIALVVAIPFAAAAAPGALSIAGVVGSVLFSAGAGCLFFGACAWIGRFRRNSVALLLLGLGGVLNLAGFVSLLSPVGLLPLWVSMSLFLAWAGVGLARRAHRAWCETELG